MLTFTYGGEKVKKYMKPQLIYVTLAVEEKYATAIGSGNVGVCPVEGVLPPWDGSEPPHAGGP